MRDELKTQVRQVQLARDREARLEKSKRSLTSYIFHELRVPLNIASEWALLLAVCVCSGFLVDTDFSMIFP